MPATSVNFRPESPNKWINGIYILWVYAWIAFLISANIFILILILAFWPIALELMFGELGKRALIYLITIIPIMALFLFLFKLFLNWIKKL